MLWLIISIICGAINISIFVTKWHLVCKWNLSEHLYQHGSNQFAWLLSITSREHIMGVKRDVHTQVESASQGIAIVTSLCETYSVPFPASRDPLSLVYLDALHLHLSVKPSAPTPCNPFQVPMYPHIPSNPFYFKEPEQLLIPSLLLRACPSSIVCGLRSAGLLKGYVYILFWRQMQVCFKLVGSEPVWMQRPCDCIISIMLSFMQ